MKLSSTTLISIALTTTVVNSAPTAGANDNSLTTRDDSELLELLANLDSYKSKRDELADLDKREYQIVTDVLRAVDNTELAPKIIHYLATSPTLGPIVVNTIVAVLKSGLLDMTTLFRALDESGLVTTVLQDLISDCSLYVSLFRTAENVISDLVDKVQDKINESFGKRDLLSDRPMSSNDNELEARDLDLNEIVVNLLESLANSGLATSVVKSIITDSDYIPVAIDLITAVLANNALDVGELVDALKNTDLATNLLKSILNANTFNTVITNAFAAFSGDCANGGSSGSGSSGSGSSGSGSGSSGSSSGSGSGDVDPCKKRRRRRRRRNYNY